MRKIFIRTVLLMSILMLCISPVFGVSEQEINTDIVNLLDCFETKCDQQKHIEKVVEYGESAVSYLIETFNKEEDKRRHPILICLCKISSDSALNFVKNVLSKQRGQFSTRAAIKYFPIQKEDEITKVLIQLSMNKQFSWDAPERLKEMIKRNPKRAGVLVMALKEESYEKSKNLYDVLEYVSGYSHWSWTESKIRPKGEKEYAVARNDFWEKWWARNKDKDQLKWLLEPLSSNSPSRRAQACQIMGSLKDKRAIPFLLKLLDDDSQRVRYWAVYGLKRLNDTAPASGYLFEVFQKHEKNEIINLKEYFKDK